MPHLENWSLSQFDWPACPPELGDKRLLGVVTNHPVIPDGDDAMTTKIITINKQEQTVTTRSGSVYTLGEPHPDYEKQYPNARERMFK